MLIIAGHTEGDSDDRDAAVAIMRDLVTRARDVPGRLDVEITADSVDQCGSKPQEVEVSATVLYMSMSLDGFIAGPNEGPDNGLGDGGERLHDWLWGGEPGGPSGVPGRPSGVNGQVYEESMATGAVVAGRGTFEPAGGWGGDHHDGVPIFVLSRQEPGIAVGQWPLVCYVPDVRTAMTRAREAAGDKDVLVHGAATAQLALAAGVLDELEIHLIPVLLGQGRRLFENLGPEQIELERVRTLEGAGGVTHLHFRVRR
jgi:dihydrofolate reductase